MKTCASASCTNTSYNSPHLTWHSLPQDDFVRDDWMELLGIPDDDEDVDPPKVCSSHFKPGDFLSNNRFLKSNARPSVRLAKTVRTYRKDKDMEEDYVVSSNESDDEIAVIPAQEPPKPEPTSTRPSRKAAQKAAEKLKKYCYASPPGSPGSPADDNYKSHSRSRSTPANRNTASTSRNTPSTSGYKPIQPMSATSNVSKPYYANNLVHNTTPKYTHINPVRTGVNVTQLPIKPYDEELAPPPRRCPIFERTGVHITLQMECYEELLAPSQVAKHQKMQAEAESFNQTLRSLRANNIAIIHHTDPNVRVTNTVTMVTAPMTNGVGNSNAVTKTTSVLNSVPTIGIVAPQRGASSAIVQQSPTMVISAPQQMIRPAVPQPTIILAPSTVVGTPTSLALPAPAAGQPLSYKVLVDSRTGIVVGTVPQTAVSITTPIISQAPPAITAAPSIQTTPTLNKPSTPAATPAPKQPAPKQPAPKQPAPKQPAPKPPTPKPPTPKPQTPTSTNPTPSKSSTSSSELPTDGCVFNLKGGNTEVNAETLLNIKAISGSHSKWLKAVTKSVLKTDLEKEKFFTEPLRWMLKMNLIVAENSCRSCGQGKFCLVADTVSTDGFKWLCNKARCAKTVPVQRLYFFSRFGCSLSRLLPLVFYWALQTDVSEVKSQLNIDTYLIRSVWRALQEVCTRAVAIKAKKLGGPGKVVEIVTVKLGPSFWIIAAMERKTGYVRLKVVRAEGDWNSFANLQKILEPWLMSKTVVMSPESSLKSLSRIGFIFTLVDKDQPHTNPQVLIHAYNITKYVKKHVKKMFGDFKLGDLKLDTVQGFLDELQWRNRFGKTPRDSFCYIFKDIAEQSGRMVTFPPTELGGSLSGGSQAPQVTLSSDSSSSSSSSSEDESEDETSSNNSSPVLTRRKSNNVSKNTPVTTSTNAKQKSGDSSYTVVLDSYYYATKKPDRELEAAEVKGNFQFKCIICKKIIDNNLKTMKHLVAHMEDNRQRNPDLSDLTQCKYCFRDFDTPFSMQCHIESVHLSTSALSCQICNHAFDCNSDLTNHMRILHVKAEMPYSCEVCNFRSSFHRDVLEHFQQAHNSSDKLLCHYCLRVYSIRFSGPEQLGHLQNYYYHLYKHQSKSSSKKCNACCLVFPAIGQMKKHKTLDHLSYEKDKSIVYGTPKSGQEVIYVSDPHKRTAQVGSTSKALAKKAGRTPRSGKGQNSQDVDVDLFDMDHMRDTDNSEPLVLPLEYSKMTCRECKNIIDPEHFSKCVSCSKCRYITYCCKAFVEHMISEHSQLAKKRSSVFTFETPFLEKALFCPCGFQSKLGNDLANHMKACNRKTCFPNWMTAVSSLVKVEPGNSSSQPLERGSAFFPPLIVLDENEEEYVNQTLSTIPEPEEQGVKPGVSGRRKRNRESLDEPNPEIAAGKPTTDASSPSKATGPPAKKACEEEQPSWLNALGLVRRPGGGGACEDETSEPTPDVPEKESAEPKLRSPPKERKSPKKRRGRGKQKASVKAGEGISKEKVVADKLDDSQNKEDITVDTNDEKEAPENKDDNSKEADSMDAEEEDLEKNSKEEEEVEKEGADTKEGSSNEKESTSMEEDESKDKDDAAIKQDSPKDDADMNQKSPKSDADEKQDSAKDDPDAKQDSPKDDSDEKQDSPEDNADAKQDSPKDDADAKQDSPKDDADAKQDSPMDNADAKEGSPKVDAGGKQDSSNDVANEKQDSPKDGADENRTTQRM